MNTDIPQPARAALRAVLQSPEPAWQRDFASLLEQHVNGLVELQRLRSFLAQHAESAGDVFQPRLRAMLAGVEEQIRLAAQDSLVLEPIAAELLELQEHRAALQARIDQLRDLIELAVGHGHKCTLGSVRITVSSPGVSLRVLEADRVPAEFTTPQPDRKAIMEHFRSTGEILPGTQVNPRRASVTVKPAPGA